MDPNNPLPPVHRSGLEAGLVEILTLPATAGSGPPARVQQFVQAQDGSDRFYALDTRGVVWRVEDGVVAPRPFLDLRPMGIGFVEPGSESGLRSIAFTSTPRECLVNLRRPAPASDDDRRRCGFARIQHRYPGKAAPCRIAA